MGMMGPPAPCNGDAQQCNPRDECAYRTAERFVERQRPEDHPDLFDKRWNDFMTLTYVIFEYDVPLVIPGKGSKQKVHELFKEALNIHQV